MGESAGPAASVSAGFAALGLLSFAIASVWLVARDVRTGTLPNRAVTAALLITGGLLTAAIIAHGIKTGDWGGAGAVSGTGTGIDAAATGAPAPATNWPPPISALRWLAETLGGAAACFSGAIALWLAAPGSLGGGDVKAAPLAGLVLGFAIGWPGVLWGVLLAAIIAALWALTIRATAHLRRSRGAPGNAEEAAHETAYATAHETARESERTSRPGPQGASPRAATLPFAPALFGGAWIVLVIDAATMVAQARS